VAALAALDFANGTGYYKGGFGIEPSFSFGSPRLGNQEFADTFKRVLGHEIFRVSHRKDPFLRYPETTKGFTHVEHELYFDGEASEEPSSYVRCTNNGENPACSQRHVKDTDGGSLQDHLEYMQPMISTNMDASSCKRAMAV